MNFVEQKVAETINESWSWIVPEIVNVLAVNSMGNCIVKDCNEVYWRLIPEELTINKIASNSDELSEYLNDSEIRDDWKLLGLINPAEDHFGPLEIGQCYGMVTPAIMGGEYSVNNLRVKSVYEYLSWSGSFAYQTKDLKDGDKIELCITD